MITITIQRRMKNDICVQGKLTANSDEKKEKFECFTLENPDLNNQRNVSCIPPGKYDAFIRDKDTSRWNYNVIQLKNVPGRSYIQIHIGNYVKDTKGCILPGMSLGQNAVWRSTEAMGKLMNFVRNSEDITVIIKDTADKIKEAV